MAVNQHIVEQKEIKLFVDLSTDFYEVSRPDEFAIFHQHVDWRIKRFPNAD